MQSCLICTLGRFLKMLNFLFCLLHHYYLPWDPLWCFPWSPCWVMSVEGRSAQSWWWRCWVSVSFLQTLRLLSQSWRARAELSWDTGCRPSYIAHFFRHRSQSWLCTAHKTQKYMRKLLYLLSAQYSDEWLFAIWTFLHTKSIHCNIFNKENGFLRETQCLPGTSRGWSKPDLSRLLSPGQRQKILVLQKRCSRNSFQTGSKSFSSPYSGFVFLSQVFWNWFKVGGKLG